MEMYKTDRERKQDYAEAERTYEQMTQVYQDCGYEVSVLPKQAPAARAEFIVRRVQCAD
jgi:predicted ATPase